jgi:F-type H+-transporting ATPase subunit b
MVGSGSIIGALLASSEGGSNPLMQIDPGVIIWTIVIFLILLFVMGKFAWKPILSALKEREDRIKESLDKADRAAVDAEKSMAKQKEQLEAQRQEMAEAIKRIREEAEENARLHLEKARADADEIAERARRQVEVERNQAIEQIRSHTVELALSAASHLLKKSLNSNDHRKIVGDYLKQLPDRLRH